MEILLALIMLFCPTPEPTVIPETSTPEPTQTPDPTATLMETPTDPTPVPTFAPPPRKSDNKKSEVLPETGNNLSDDTTKELILYGICFVLSTVFFYLLSKKEK